MLAVAISPAARLALSGGQDKTLRLWWLGDDWDDVGNLQLAKPEPLIDLIDAAHRRASLLAEIDKAINAKRPAVALEGLAALESLPGQRRSPQVLAARRRLSASCRRGGVRTAWPLRQLLGHKASYWAGSQGEFSSDGRIAMALGSGAIRLWDVESGNCLRMFEGSGEATLSLNGRRVLLADSETYSGPSSLDLWDVASGERVRIFEEQNEHINSIAFSPYGNLALSRSSDCNSKFQSWKGGVPEIGTLRLWDVDSGKCLRILEQDQKGANQSQSFSSNGHSLIAWGSKMVRLWDVESGKCLSTFDGHADWEISAAFSADGGMVLFLEQQDNLFRLWDATSGKSLRMFQGHTGPVTSVVFSGDHRYFLTAGQDGTSRLWNVDTGEGAQVPLDGAEPIALSPDATMLLAADSQSLRVWYIDWELLSSSVDEFSGTAPSHEFTK